MKQSFYLNLEGYNLH